jgi:anti-sigma regulatory factor (Ser/Thr protein kinase)
VASRSTDPPPSLDERLPATVESVWRARMAMRDFAAALDVDVQGVELAVSEAVANAAVHAYPDGAGGPVRLSATASPYELTVVVRDHGAGMRADGSPGSGFGLAIIRRLARRVEVADTADGVAVTMSFPRGGAWAEH